MPTNPPELPPGITTPEDDATQQLMLSPEQRKALLGKLAEFEIALLELAPNQQNFVMAYLTDPTNGSAAARKAGYNGNVAVRASKLLSYPPVAAAIALGQSLREDRTFITSERTLNELAIIAFSDISNFEVGPGGKIRLKPGVPEYAMRAVSKAEYTVTEIDDGERTTVTYKTKIHLWSKPEALRMLAMYQKLLSGEGGVNLTVNDNRGQVHTHNYQHNEWQWGDRKVKF
jgi:hypothetical protein